VYCQNQGGSQTFCSWYPVQKKLGKYTTYICITDRKKYIVQVGYMNFKCRVYELISDCKLIH
jgi:hypothetical protein